MLVLVQQNCAVLTSRGYVDLSLLDTKDILVSVDENTGKQVLYNIHSILRAKYLGRLNTIRTQYSTIPTRFLQNTLILNRLDDVVGFSPVKILTRKHRPIWLGKCDPDLLNVTTFPGIEMTWVDIAQLRQNQIRVAYKKGEQILGITPFLLYDQLRSENNKVFNGLLKLEEERREKILPHLAPREKGERQISFRTAADALNFQLLFAGKHKTSIVYRHQPYPQYVTIIHEDKDSPLDEKGFGDAHLSHGFACYDSAMDLISIETNAPTVVVNSYIVKNDIRSA